MRIEFYHIDAFEAPHYEPIWRALQKSGVDARLIAIPDSNNTSSPGWFDFERLKSYYDNRGVPFLTSSDYECSAITTQNECILGPYKGLHIRLQYGPVVYPDAWNYREIANRPFDAVLVHGSCGVERISKWKSKDEILVVGYPHYDDFFSGRIDSNAYFSKWDLDKSKATIVYLPTWQERSSIDGFLDKVSSLASDFNVLIKPHHCTLRMEPQRMARIERSGLTIIQNAYYLPELFSVADLVIADTRSGAFFESIMTETPTIGLADSSEFEQWLEPYGITRIAPICTAKNNISQAVNSLLEKDGYKSARQQWAERNVSYRDGTAAKHAAEEITKFIERKQQSCKATSISSISTPRVSVVLPTYNHLEFLPKVVDSILSQTFTDFELIIVNDGSTDKTKKYLDSLNDPRIRVIHQNNKRLPGALNAGFRQAQGQLLTWISSDNYCSPVFLETFVSALDENPDAGLAYSAFARIDERDRITQVTRCPGLDYRQLLLRFPGMASFMYRRCCQDKVGFYDASLEGAEDWDMWLRIAEHFKLLYVPDVLYYYRQHQTSMTTRIHETIAKNSRATFENAVTRLPLDVLYPGLRYAKDRQSAELCACIDFATDIMQSKWSGTSAATMIMKKVFAQLSSSTEIASNLAVAMGMSGQWDHMTPAIALMDRSNNQEVLHNLRLLEQGRQSRDSKLLKSAMIFKVDANELSPLKEIKSKRPAEMPIGRNNDNQPAIPNQSNGVSIEYFLKAREEFNKRNFESAYELMHKYRTSIDYRSLPRFIKGEKGKQVDVSVVIVTYNRTEDVRECIETVEKQQTPRENYEIIVVDNGRTDEKIVRPLCDQYIKCPANLYLSEGRNIGACFARGRIIAFLDDDALVESDYIGSIKDAFDKYDIFGFRGKVLPKTDTEANRQAVNYDRGDKPFCTFCDQEGNSAFLKDVYLDCEGMDPLFFGAEGSDLSYRITKKYKCYNKVIYWPDTVIYHDNAPQDTQIHKSKRHSLMHQYFQLKHGRAIFEFRKQIEERELPGKRPLSLNQKNIQVLPKKSADSSDVPVALITYNRPKHTYEVLRALRRNNVKNIYIFSDAPKKQEDAEKVAMIRKLAKTINWTEPKIIERTGNLGLARNIIDAVDHVFTENDRLILLEDDCVPQKYFFNFMNTCLRKYKDNDKIFGVSGYTVQIPEHILRQWPYDLYFYPRIGSWGWATWKKAWQLREKDLKAACDKAKRESIDICQGGNDVLKMIDQYLEGSLKDVWTLHWVITVYLNNGYYIYPAVSHVNNIGMDGSGVHIGKTDRFETKIADRGPSRFPDEIIVDEEIYNNFRKFYDVPDYPRTSVTVSEEASVDFKFKPDAASSSISSSKKPIKVVHVCTHDHGGAGKAAYRLNKALQSYGYESSMLVLSKKTDDASVHVAKSASSCEEVFNRNINLMSQFPNRPVGLEMYSGNFGAVELAAEPLIQQADIVNLHWVAGMLNYDSILSTLKDKIIVWTLHDMNPFTGGCHYAGDCEKYKLSCNQCFQLGSNQSQDLSSRIWEQKKQAYDRVEINVVTPSRWLADCSKKSSLFSGYKTEVIPNSLPVDVYKPYPKRDIRAALNIREDAKVILFGAGSIVNERKGFRYLLEAVKTFELDGGGPRCIATFGGMPKNIQIESRYPVLNFGQVSDEQDLAALYSIADVFVLPSLEDNLPNIVMESMACSVPVVGFEVGGIPDMVEHKKTGYLVRPRDIEGLKEGIKWVLSAPSQGINLSRACREKVEKLYAPDVQAKAYESLYNRLCKNAMPRKILPSAEVQSYSSGYLVSAIVSAYNSEKFIRGCLEDLENQTIADKLEIVVINSGSQQNEEAIVKEFQQRYDNIKYIKTEQRETIYQAWNRAVEAASGKYLTVANTDDRHRRDAIEIMADVLESDPGIALVYADQYETCVENEPFENITATGESVYPDFEPDVFLETGFCKIGSQPMWRACIHKQIGLFDGNFEVAGDYDFLLRVCEKYRCFHVPQILGTFYRSRGETISCSNEFRLNKIENPLAKSRSLVRKGVECIEKEEYKHGIEYLQKSIECWPSREASDYIRMVKIRTGRLKNSNSKPTPERLPSIWDWPRELANKGNIRHPVDKFEDDKTSKYVLTIIAFGYSSAGEIEICFDKLGSQILADRLEILVIAQKDSSNIEAAVKSCRSNFAHVGFVELNQNENIWVAVNRAVNSAEGKYLTIIKPGYEYRSNTFEEMIRRLEKSSELAGLYATVGENNLVSDRYGANRINENCITMDRLFDDGISDGRMIWRRSLHKIYGYFDEAFLEASEFEFLLRIGQDYNLECINNVLSGCPIDKSDLDLSFERGLVQKVYQYGKICSIRIDKRGISGNEFFAGWFEINILKKRTWEKLNIKEYELIRNINDGRKHAISPLLSIIIVTRDRNKALIDNLGALAKQTESNFEVIIINNGSCGFDDILSNDLSVCWIDLGSNYGPSLARNLGADYARAEKIAFLDDDAVAEENFVRNILLHFEERDICGLRGRVLASESEFAPDAYDLGDVVIPFAADLEGNCAFSKEMFQKKIGGFDERLFHFEGFDLSYKIFTATGENIDSILYVPDVVVYHEPHRNDNNFIEKSLRYDQMHKLIHGKHPNINRYLDFMYNFYPSNLSGIDKKLGRLVNNASFLLDKKPDRALEWAKTARENFPDDLRPRLVLGSAYFKLGDLEKARDELRGLFLVIEEIFEQETEQSREILAGKKEFITDIYLQTISRLSQCCSRLGDYGMVKTVYERALLNTGIEIPSEQRAGMEALLKKLKSMPLSTVPAAPLKESVSVSKTPSQKEYLVSAIVSTYNAEEFIRGCLEDLENQTIADKLEIIVVDGGSEQNEKAVVRAFQGKYDNIVYIRTEQKESVYQAWNRAIKVAKGKFLTNANTDDRHRADAFEILSNELNNNPEIALVYADQICTETPNATFEKHDAVETHPQPDYSRERLLKGCCVGSQPMWRSSLHKEFGYFDETLDCAADWDFWLRISEKYDFKRVPEFLGVYYFNREGIEHGNMFHSYYERYAVGRRYGTEYITTFNTYQTKRNWLVSVILPAYNAEKYISQAIESVLIQNYRHFELVIINDGSTDRTEEIIESYKDEHIRYFKQSNRGLAATHNEGIRQARGEFLIKVDADDFIAVDFIGRHLNEFYNHRDADLVYCDDYLVEEDSKPIRIVERPEYSDRRILIRDLFRAGFPVVPFRTCIRRHVFEKIGLFNESLRIGEDYDIMKRFVKAGLKAQHLRAALYYRRMTSESLSRQYSINKARVHFKIVKSYAETFSHDELFPGVKWELIPSGMRQLHFKCLVAMNFISLGRTYIETNLPSYARVALESAGEQLRNCLEIDPGNENVEKLIDRCRQLEENLPEDVLMNV